MNLTEAHSILELPPPVLKIRTQIKTCIICNFTGEKFKFTRSNKHPKCKKCKREADKKYHEEYRKNNKYKILEINKIYKRKLRKESPGFRLSNNCSRVINIALNGSKDKYSIWKFLPYTIRDLQNHLESKFDLNMNWENYGSYWHLDHIVPHSHFKYISMIDSNFIECWSLNNLQPLEAITNIKKSNRILYEIK